MAQARRSRGRLVPVAGAGALFALVAGSLTTPAQAAPVAAAPLAAVECPVAVPMSTVQAGLKGQGLTVVTGTTPQPFDVEVLGVLEDGIGAGRDMVIIKVSDVAGGHVIDQGGGIWAGMSGSPVYVDGKLLGAVSYGFTNAPSPIGGLTPAADMFDVLGLGSTRAAKPESSVEAKTVKLSTTAKRQLASRAQVAAPSGTLARLVTPLSISGLGPDRISQFQRATDAAGWSVKAYAGSRRAAPKAAAAPAARPEAGGNFGALLSYGDVTAGGVGTTTAVCGDKAVAFGHPLNLTGPASYGANDASSVAIIKDDSFGSFKMANFGAAFGTVDQDRIAALRADLTAVPTGTDITTYIRNLDTGKRRTGVTTVVDRASLPGLVVPAVFANQDAVFDEWSDGTATSYWKISGTRAGGVPFSISRSNKWASQEDVTIEPAIDVAEATDALQNNEFEDVKITSVDFSQAFATKFEQVHISKLQVFVNGKLANSSNVTAKAGDTLAVRTFLSPYRSTSSYYVTQKVVVPKNAAGQRGVISATGGVDLAREGGDTSLECLLTGDCEDESAGSLNGIISGLTSAPRNDALVVGLQLEPEDEFEEEAPAPVASVTQQQRLTVTGQRSVGIIVR